MICIKCGSNKVETMGAPSYYMLRYYIRKVGVKEKTLRIEGKYFLGILTSSAYVNKDKAPWFDENRMINLCYNCHNHSNSTNHVKLMKKKANIADSIYHKRLKNIWY